MSQYFNSFSIARSPYNKRGRALLRGVIIVKRAAQTLTNEGRRDKREKKKESYIFTKV
jgi:hypothetical protein